jgi:GDP-L-fucose synthase
MSLSLSRFKRIIVTGSGGVLGAALSGVLEAFPEAKVACLTRKDCDLLDGAQTEAWFADFRPDLVLHLAGKVFGVQGNIDFCGEIFYENSRINMNVIEAARKSGAAKVVAAGTAAIYSDLAPMPMKEDDLWLGPPHGSEGPYGHAKRAMLAQLEAYNKQYGLEYAYLILTNLYGPNDRFDEKYGHVVPSLISRFVKAAKDDLPEVVCWGDGTPTRDFLFARDAAKAFLYAAEYGAGAMNVATGNAIPIRDLVAAIAQGAGYRGEVKWDVSKPLGQKMRSYDVTRIKGLGWQPEYSLQDGINETIHWFSNNSAQIRI